MNKFITAIKNIDIEAIERLLTKEPQWLTWAEEDGKNALHYLGGVVIASRPGKEEASLQILRLFVENGMDINAIHRIKDGCGYFPATPLWYAYTRGRNKTLYTWLLNNGANPGNCMFAIAWYDDAEAAELFKYHGADIDDASIGETPVMAAINWKKFAVAEWFLKNGANANTADKDGNTCLHQAVKRKYPPKIIELLLKYGADPNQENKAGASPKSIARQQRPPVLMALFDKAVS
ncbi:ankyrin repeat domain-containing protein [Mucilaginibacter sp. ZT4R22]|uniref:Ankyrin repeat domain-containing protein n=1 Tax=Mucilaginibacter pankratovii TaxID=2772110 RepID=A0ABR7WR91_9SPHI|nr:ankyrin repeat domain-containing protein [Mucilaginibacter pankratovii]MBD1364746.1 ankyrin repeat domain-containing protein [Mucilaginibacter pankratovii]